MKHLARLFWSSHLMPFVIPCCIFSFYVFRRVLPFLEKLIQHFSSILLGNLFDILYFLEGIFGLHTIHSHFKFYFEFLIPFFPSPHKITSHLSSINIFLFYNFNTFREEPAPNVGLLRLTSTRRMKRRE